MALSYPAMKLLNFLPVKVSASSNKKPALCGLQDQWEAHYFKKKHSKITAEQGPAPWYNFLNQLVRNKLEIIFKVNPNLIHVIYDL